MQIICTSLQTDNHTSTSPLTFFTGQMLFLTPNQQCQSPKGKWQLRRNTINVETASYLIRPWWNPRARWFSNENSRKHLHRWDNTFSSSGEVCSKYTTYVLQIKSVNCVAKDVSKKCAILPQKRRWETHLPYWGQWDHRVCNEWLLQFQDYGNLLSQKALPLSLTLDSTHFPFCWG